MQREVFPAGSTHTQQDPRWDQTQNSRCCSTWSQREEQDGSAGSRTEGAGYPCRAPGRKKPLSGQQGHLQYILYIYYNCTSSRHLQLYSQPRERAHARQENTEVFLQSICSSWLPPRQETETVKEEDWNFSLMCWLVRGAAAVGSRVFGSRDPTGAAGLGLRPLGKSPAAGLGSDVLRGFPHIPAGLGGPAASLSFPWGRCGGRGLWGSSWNCWDGFRSAWLRVCRDAGGTHVLHLPRLQESRTLCLLLLPQSHPELPPCPGLVCGDKHPECAPPYLFTPFLTALLVQVSLPAGGWDTQDLAPITAQLLGFSSKGW